MKYIISHEASSWNPENEFDSLYEAAEFMEDNVEEWFFSDQQVYLSVLDYQTHYFKGCMKMGEIPYRPGDSIYAIILRGISLDLCTDTDGMPYHI